MHAVPGPPIGVLLLGLLLQTCTAAGLHNGGSEVVRSGRDLLAALANEDTVSGGQIVLGGTLPSTWATEPLELTWPLVTRRRAGCSAGDVHLQAKDTEGFQMPLVISQNITITSGEAVPWACMQPCWAAGGFVTSGIPPCVHPALQSPGSDTYWTLATLIASCDWSQVAG